MPFSKRNDSLGDDLPHMPTISSSVHQYGAPHIEKQSLKSSWRPDSQPSDWQSPSAYHQDAEDDAGDESVLLTREVRRLQKREPEKIKRRRRIRAGAACLLLMALTAYCLARYVVAWLRLRRPANSAVSQVSSSDSLLGTMALLSVILTAYTLLLLFISALYLRFSRKRSCATPVVFLTVMLGGIIMIVTSLANLGLIAAWHTYYSTKGSNSSRAATRDVARRCKGQWEFDLIWNAAGASQPDVTAAGSNTACPSEVKTFHLFIVAACIRLLIFVSSTVLFLHLLRRYNQALQLGLSQLVPGHEHAGHRHHQLGSHTHVDERMGTVGESAELHAYLLKKESTLPHAESVPGSLAGPTLRGSLTSFNDLEKVPTHTTLTEERIVYESEPQGAPQPRNDTAASSLIPRLSRFGWQRGEPSTAGGEYQHISIAGIAAPAAHPSRDASAEGWGAAIYRRLLRASSDDTRQLAAPTAEHRPLVDAKALPRDQDLNERSVPAVVLDHDQWYSDLDASRSLSPVQHEKGASRLGVSGWFGGKDYSDDEESQPPWRFRSPSVQTAASDTSLTSHRRSASQERRRQEARHAASKAARGRRSISEEPVGERVGDDLPSMPPLRDPVGTDQAQARQNHERRAMPSPAQQRQQSPSSRSSGLPSQSHPRRASGDSNAGPGIACPTASPSSAMTSTSVAPSYVRHLGRMVQKLPSIKSGDGDASSSRNASESSARRAGSANSGSAGPPNGRGSGLLALAPNSGNAPAGRRTPSLGTQGEAIQEADESAAQHSRGNSREVPGGWHW